MNTSWTLPLTRLSSANNHFSKTKGWGTHFYTFLSPIFSFKTTIMSYKFFPHTEDDIRAMLKTCGEKSLDDLYKDIPEDLVLKKNMICQRD